jgi:hypothetical protein
MEYLDNLSSDMVQFKDYIFPFGGLFGFQILVIGECSEVTVDKYCFTISGCLMYNYMLVVISSKRRKV